MAILLLSTGLSTLIVSASSSFRLAVAGPDTAVIAILAALVAGIAQTTMGQASSVELETLVFIALAGTTLFVGAMLLLFGVLRLGMWIRYIPFPVIAGFLTASGFLLVLGALRLLVGNSFSLTTLPDPTQANVALPLSLAVVLAALLGFAHTRRAHPAVIPLVLVCAVLLVDGAVWAFGLSLADARALGLVVMPVESSALGLPWLDIVTTPIEAPLLLNWASEVGVATAVTAIAILLNVTGLEVAEHTPANLDHELRSNGIANLIVGACGGVITNVSLNRSQANRVSGATSRMSGMVAGILCLAAIVIGPEAVKWVPTPVVAGLLIYLGGWLIGVWLVRPWKQLSAIDNLLVIAIPLLVVERGYLQATGFGVIASCIIFAVKYSRMRVIKHDLTRREYSSRVDRSPDQSAFLKQNGDLIHIMWVQGYLFFGTANHLLEGGWKRMSGSDGRAIRFLVLDLSDVTGIDSSSVLSFTKLADRARANNVTLVLTGISNSVRKALAGDKFLTKHSNVVEFAQVDQGLEWAEKAVLAAADIDAPSETLFESWLDKELRRSGAAQRFMRYLELMDLKPGAILFHRGDPADSLYIVCSGRVSVMLDRQNTDAVRLRSTTAFTVVGEMGLYRDQTRTANVVADEPSRVYRLSKTALMEMERNEPDLCAAFHAVIVRILADRLGLATTETGSLRR